MAIQTRLEDMVIGDSIEFDYVASTGAVGKFERLGSPLFSSSINTVAAPGNKFSFIYVGKDFKGRMILICNRNVQNSISWDVMNSAGVATQGGVEITSLGLDPTKWKTNIRLLTGGAASATNSEWDKYIVNGADSISDDSWNWQNIYSWTSTTRSGYSSGAKVVRGHSAVSTYSSGLSNELSALIGFRPVLVAESLSTTPPTSFLIQEGEDVKTYTDQWETIALLAPIEQDFLDYGITNLSLIPADAWNELGDTFEVLQYVSDVEYSNLSFETESYTAFDLLGGTPKVLMYHDDPSKSSASANLTAIPHGQLIFQEGDLDVKGGIQSIEVSAANARFIASVDSGITWKVVTGTEWQSITAESAAVKENGMTPASVNGVTTEQWETLLNGSSTLRFAYYLEQDKLTDDVKVDAIKVVKNPVATETPTLDSVKIAYEELTIEGRLQDLEKINAINMGKLQFKSNSVLQSEKYGLHDLVVDTFESSDSVDASKTTSTYDTINKEYSGEGSVILPVEELPVHRKKLMLNPDHEGVTFEISLDDGLTWEDVMPFTLIDLTGKNGNKLKIKANLQAGSRFKGVAFSWV